MAASVGQFLYTWYSVHPKAAVHKDHDLFSFLGVLWLLPLCECDFIGVMILLPFHRVQILVSIVAFPEMHI